MIDVVKSETAFCYRYAWTLLLQSQNPSSNLEHRNVKIPLIVDPLHTETALLTCLLGQCLMHGQRLVQEVAILDYYGRYLAKQMYRKTVVPRPMLLDGNEKVHLDFASIDGDPDWEMENGQVPRMI